MLKNLEQIVYYCICISETPGEINLFVFLFSGFNNEQSEGGSVDETLVRPRDHLTGSAPARKCCALFSKSHKASLRIHSVDPGWFRDPVQPPFYAYSFELHGGKVYPHPSRSQNNPYQLTL